MSASYVYVVIRRDLPLPHQITQACHAAFEAAREFRDHLVPGTPPNLITLAVPNLDALERLSLVLYCKGIRHHVFWEPDSPDGADSAPMGKTALASQAVLEPGRKWFSGYPLWTPK